MATLVPGCQEHAYRTLDEFPAGREETSRRAPALPSTGCRYAKGDEKDACAVHSTDKDPAGVEIGAQAESYWLRVVPWAFYKLLKYVDDR